MNLDFLQGGMQKIKSLKRRMLDFLPPAFREFLWRARRGAIVAGIFVLLGTAIYCYSHRNRAENFDLKQLVPDQIVAARTGDIRRTVSATGKIVPNREITIKCKASGQISELPFEVSDSVKTGEVLVKLDPVDEERSVLQAKVNLQIAENNLATARLNLQVATERLENDRAAAQAALASAKIDRINKWTIHERNQQLFTKKLLSQEQLDNSQLAAEQADLSLQNKEISLAEIDTRANELALKKIAIADAEANLETKKLALSDAEQRLQDTTVKSPSDGIVAALNVQIGQIVSSGTNNTGGGTEIMTISDVAKMFADVEVDESEIAGIDVGQPVEVIAESQPERKFSGSVRRIYSRGTRTRGVVNFRVHIEIDQPELKYLRSEMSVNVEIILAAARQTVLLPQPAIRSDNEGSFVMIKTASGKEEKRSVITGITNNRDTQIISGLTAGEQVVISVSNAESRWIRNALNRSVMTEWQSGRGARPQRR